MLVDNVLFHGQVLEENIKGKNAIAIDEFNKHVANDNRVEQLILTIRDGITIIKKL
jgi:predicted O-methyltransferase YrrM